MSRRSALFALLEAENEPTAKLYTETMNDVIRQPQYISDLTLGSMKDAVLIYLTTREYRLARFFDVLHHSVRGNSGSSSTFNLARETATFLASILSDLDQLLKPEKVVELLVPSLEICFAPSQPPILRKLALVLGGCGTLLEHLVSDRYGSRMVRQWVYLPSTLALDAGTQEAWTGRLVNMVSSCPGYHNVAPSIQQWATLIALKDKLQVLETSLLEEEDRRSSLARPQETRSLFFPLDDDLKRILSNFDLVAPESRRMIQSHVDTLKGNKIPAILRSIAISFPCKRCISALGSTPRSTNAETHDENTKIIENLQIDVLGKAMGLWKVLLSGPALRSMQNLSRLSVFSPVGKKLVDLASGCCKSSLAGSGDQRQRLKVPLAKSKCTPTLSILWQVDLGIAGDSALLQQVIVVWEVGDSEAISKAIDRIIHLQGSYTEENIRRCRRNTSLLDGKRTPAYFVEHTSQLARLGNSSQELDVRTVDQNTIDMANKFYALTEPVIRSILDNDLAAEFPFDLSMEEARVIMHFQTASLILGRSGTGKTTCLIFKLVGKFLASKAILDERPARQVLLTRSSFLAEKLQAYTRRLIKTLSLKPLQSESFEFEEHLLSMTFEEDSECTSVLTLRDQSFPLICTFEHFLNILENTSTELDRQNYEDIPRPEIRDVSRTAGSYQRRCVDFYAFKVEYWPRFSQHLTKDLSVNLVFAEIMGVIKGSIFSRKSLSPVSREEYLAQSCRLAPTFVSEAERSAVYDVFGLYERLKLERNDTDYVDRVVKLLRAVRQDQSLHQLLRSTFDEIYIDEIQDQRCLDIELFLSFLKDGRGFHFAGDTAQAISHDSTFRFSDIKRLFYEHFAEASNLTKQCELAEPRMFTLSKNYRSHQGILAVASLVMNMIWKGFPETVDKLDPEVGNLSGPKPVLFVGCDVDILRTRNVGSSSLSKRAADFGAEQVILVRDTKSKTSLQDQVGDVALILTILESKGMEFEDVILWNFFSECPDQVGVRILNALKNDENTFDPWKHGGMCSELKHLYVAITRARSQLSIIEGSETTATPVLKLLTEGFLEPLVDVARPNDANFAMRVEELRPNSSVDHAAWSQRANELMRRHMFKEALMAFNRAGDTQGETRAQGFLKEEEGRLRHADKDIEGFTRNMKIAIECFLRMNMVGDAVRVLIELGELGEAAEKWFECKQYARAAPIFTDAGLHTKAAECHHLLQNYSEAAASLRQGGKYDQIVYYVNKNCQRIHSDTLRGYGLLCKLLLKQSKVSAEYRKDAIKLLGSQVEQEACFLEYGMDEQLAELLTDQKRYKDLYGLFYRTGQLERALEIGLSDGLLHSGVEIAETEVLKLLDYVWTSPMTKKRQQDFAASLRLRSDILTPKVACRIKGWKANCCIDRDVGSNGYQSLAEMEDTALSRILTFEKIIDATAIHKTHKLDDIPIEIMQDSVRIVQDLFIKNDKHALSVLFIFTGVWSLGGSQERYLLLPWSPLHENTIKFSATDVPQAAKRWALDKLASTVLALDARAKVLWNSKWRIRCPNHLVSGACRQHNCQKLHEDLSYDHCSGILEDFLRVNNFFCSLAALYYHRVMGTTLQQKYLGIRRQWLERLLRELTFLSSTEQSASAVMEAQTELLHGHRFLAVRSSLEDLLYYRLNKKEWKDRSEFTSLLEQMQVAEAFGPTVRSRFFQALSHNLDLDNRTSSKGHLSLLNHLRLAPNSQNAAVFRQNLDVFLRDLEHHKTRTFRSLHAFTAVCESLATYLILKTCGAACVITQSWLDLHRPIATMAAHSLEVLEWDDRYRYQQCLLALIKGFCRVLHRMNQSPTTITLLCSSRPHDALLLKKRNAELVAIMIANLATICPLSKQVWLDAEGLFAPDVIRAFQRQRTHTPATAGEIIQKLAPPLLKHNSKDALIVIVKDRNKGLYFSNLENQPGVKIVPFNQLRPIVRDAGNANVSTADPSPPTSTDTPQEGYTAAEVEAVTRTQRLWRSSYRKIKDRRSYMQRPDARAIAHFIFLGAQCPDRLSTTNKVAIRALLVSYGVAASLRLSGARDTLSKLHKDAMTCAEEVEISTDLFASVDDILCRNRDVEALLKNVEDKMPEESLTGLVKEGVLSVLEKEMKVVEKILVQAEEIMLQARKMLEVVSHK